MSKQQSLGQFARWESNRKQRFALWVEKSNNIHNFKFDYSKVDYRNSHDKVTIVCPIHGKFSQKPCAHVDQKQGCPECSHNFPWTHDQFSSKSKELYNDKFELVSKYQGMKHPITLRCKEHGIFNLKKAEAHLKRNGGCPTCWYSGRLENLKPGNISKVEKKWLDSLAVPLRQYKLNIGSQTFLVDGFDPATNTVYECYGSFWHGNPEKYNPSEMNTKIGKTFGRLYGETVAREQIIKQQYHLVTKWV
jgi:hypothetical protein